MTTVPYALRVSPVELDIVFTRPYIAGDGPTARIPITDRQFTAIDRKEFIMIIII